MSADSPNIDSPETSQAPRRSQGPLVGILLVANAGALSWAGYEFQQRQDSEASLSALRVDVEMARQAEIKSRGELDAKVEALQLERSLREKLEESLSRTGDNLTEAVRQARDLAEARREHLARMVALEEQLGHLKADRDDLQLRLTAAQDRLAATEAQILDLGKRLDDWQRRESTTRSELGLTRGQLNEMTERLKLEQERLSRLEAEFHINWKRRLGVTSPPPLEASVVKVEAQTPPALVINAGSKDGLEIDEQLYIVRAGKVIGEARIVQIADARSVAIVRSLTDVDSVSSGDLVCTRKPGS